MSHDHAHPHTIEELEETLHAHDDWFRHGAEEPHHKQAHGDLNAWLIIAFMAATVGVVVAVGFPTYLFWEKVTRDQLTLVNEGRTPRAEYLSLRAEWNKHLTSYEWSDPAKGTVRIPIDVAKSRVIAYYASKEKAAK